MSTFLIGYYGHTEDFTAVVALTKAVVSEIGYFNSFNKIQKTYSSPSLDRSSCV